LAISRAKRPATTSPQPQFTKEVTITVITSTTTARFGVVAIPANLSSNRLAGGEFDSAYPVTKTSTIWNANARMLNSPLYHPVRIMSADPFGARIPANSAVSIVSATAKMYGSGVIRSKRKRKNEVTDERRVRGLDSDEVERAPEFGATFGVGIGTNVKRMLATVNGRRLAKGRGASSTSF
jgi:hypothetical protein